MMALSALVLFLTAPKPWIAELATLAMAGVCIWLWMRPLPPDAARH
jgi:hypothetical protein